MSERNSGYLDSEARVQLAGIVHAATELIDVVARRLAETPSQQLDESSNSWWRNYDKCMQKHVNTINWRLRKFEEPEPKPPLPM